MSDVERAKSLLRKLQARTEARGATAAEAAAAAELAAKLIARYGLDQYEPETTQDSVELEQKRFPSWAMVLGMALSERFEVENRYTRRTGERSTVVFLGLEHRVRVACWLFRAVATDLQRIAERDAQTIEVSGSDKVVFRNEFLRSAAWEVYRRLNHDWRAKLAGPIDKHQQRKRKTRSRQLAKRRNAYTDMAHFCGQQAGKQVSLATDVLGDNRVGPALCIEHQATRPKRQSALF
jgi:hypothetical protein